MSSGIKSITRTVFDSGGGRQISGSRSLSGSLAQPSPVGIVGGGPGRVGEGFFGGLGSGTAPTVIISTGFITRYYQDWIVGVGVSTPAALTFSKDMLASSLAGSARVTLIRDELAADQDLSVAVSTAYASASREFTLMSSAGGGLWAHNHTYRVDIDTSAVDEEGIPLVSSASFVFQTRLSPPEANVVKPPPLANDGSLVVMTPGALTQEGHVEISTFAVGSYEGLIAAANSRFASDHRGGKIHEIRAVDFYNAAQVKTAAEFTGSQTTLYFKYKDLNGDGIIDGGSPDSAQVSNAKLYALDEAEGVWVELPGAQVSVSSSAVYCAIPHLSYYAIGTSLGSAFGQIFAYPSPFRPHGPEAGIGAGLTGTDEGGITFMNLPLNSKVEVYNVRGELVWDGRLANWSGKLVWDTRTNGGQKAGSGVYIYVVTTPEGKKIDKLSIVR